MEQKRQRLWQRQQQKRTVSESSVHQRVPIRCMDVAYGHEIFSFRCEDERGRWWWRWRQ